MSKGKVLVTPRSATKPPHESLSRISDAGYELVIPSPGALPTLDMQLECADQIVGYLAGVEQIGKDFLSRASQLRVISRNGTGSDAIDLAAAKQFGIEVRTAPAANAQGVAELTIGLILQATRNLAATSSAFARGEWSRQLGVELQGRTLGLVGCGQIGKRVAQIALGFGMRVRAFDAYADPSFKPAGDFQFASFEEVLESSQILSLHCPPSEKPIIGRTELAKLEPGAYLINTARFGLVDLGAVFEELKSGKLAGFACDAFEPEPPEPHPVYRHENFIGTAHIGGYTKESIERAMQASVDNLLAVLES